MRVEAGVERGEFEERAAEHARGSEKYEGERDFGDNECSVKATGVSCDSATADAKGPIEIFEWDAECGSESEDQSAEKRDADGEDEDAPVDVDFLCARKAAGPKGHEGANADCGERDAERAPCQAEYGTFGEALAYEAAEAGAKSDAHRELALARHGASEHEAGDIHARDQRDEGYGDE